MSTKLGQLQVTEARDFIEQIEPFVDMDIRALRQRLMSQELLGRTTQLVQEKLGVDQGGTSQPLVELLAGMMVDIHLLKAAYVERLRYKDPEFAPPLPQQDVPLPAAAQVDFRADITGRNWWGAEADGRWAGPEHESSVFVPAVQPGQYELRIDIADEIAADIIDGTTCTFDRQPATLTRDNAGVPVTLRARVEVPATHRLPFHVVKLLFPRLHSPVEFGSGDTRMLAVRVSQIALSRAGE